MLFDLLAIIRDSSDVDDAWNSYYSRIEVFTERQKRLITYYPSVKLMGLLIRRIKMMFDQCVDAETAQQKCNLYLFKNISID